MATKTFTPAQLNALRRAVEAEARRQLNDTDAPHGTIRADTAGERVTLASLYYRGMLDRADDHGRSDGSTRGYMYWLSPITRKALQRTIDQAKGTLLLESAVPR
jgi:hypothetical protein